MKRLLISSLMLTLLLGTVTIFSQPQKQNLKHDQDFRGLKIEKMLKLSDEQSSKFNDIKYQHQLSVIDIKSEMQKNQVNINKMMADNKVDADRLIDLTKANSKLQGNLKTSKTKMWLDIYNLLNEDQKEVWTKTFNNFGHRGNREGFGHGYGIGRNNCFGKGKPGFGPMNYKGLNDQE